MLRGVSLYQGTLHADGTGLLSAVDKWAGQAGKRPNLVPIWNPFSKAGQAPAGGEFPSTTILNGLRARGIEPMVYMTSISNTDSDEDWGFQSYWEGDHDDALDTWATAAASYGKRLIVRWDQEMNMNWPPWGGQPAWKYRKAFDYVQARLQATATNVKMYYCPGANPLHIKSYCPTKPDFVGFDKYSKTDDDMSIPKSWADAIKACKALPASNIIVGEFARRSTLSRRSVWLDTLDSVSGVWATVYFDVNTNTAEDGSPGIWSMTDYMRKVYMQTV